MAGLPVAMLAEGAAVPGDSAAAACLQGRPAAIPTALEEGRESGAPLIGGSVDETRDVYLDAISGANSTQKKCSNNANIFF